MINIAIDGPAGAGKSSIAKAVSKRFGYVYVDTGALYRTIALNVSKNSIDFDNVESIVNLLESTNVSLTYLDDGQHVLLNGADVSNEIRTPEISMAASKVSKIPEVREFLLSLQRDIAKKNNCIMDGRDIGTVVLPDAKIKVFLTASAECRAERRYKELIEKGENVEYDDVLKDIKDRDYADSHRKIAPLKPSKDSITFDTSSMSLDESVEGLIKIVKENS